MAFSVTEDEIQEIYHRYLSTGSRGREADNPREFASYFTDPNFDRSKFYQNIVLAEDLKRGGITWHWYCNRATTEDLISSNRRGVENIASAHRMRKLKFLEVYTRSGEGYLLEESN